jgi:hypothetical protein
MLEDGMDPLRRAAEEVAWLLGRAYPAGAVSTFVASHHRLTEQQRTILATNARLGAQARHHIARELDPEDVSRRPLHVDISQLVGLVATALAGETLIKSEAGLLASTAAEPAGWTGSAEQVDALARCCRALASLRPKTLRLCVDGRRPAASDLAAAVNAASKTHKLKKAAVEIVDDPAVALAGVAIVASSDPVILDRCATWVNVAQMALEGANHPAPLCFD